MSTILEEEVPRWLPIESDPNILTDYLKMMTFSNRYLIDMPAIDAPEEFGLYQYHNVLGYILLYQLKPELPTLGTLETEAEILDGLYYMKQYISNSCATVALIHTFLNTIQHDSIDKDSVLGKFFTETANKSPEIRGECFIVDRNIKEMHETTSRHGQSSLPDNQQQIDFHYTSIVPHRGHIIELDGRKSGPVNHGPCGSDFIKSGLEVVKKFIESDPGNLHFSVLAFCSPPQ